MHCNEGMEFLAVDLSRSTRLDCGEKSFKIKLKIQFGSGDVFILAATKYTGCPKKPKTIEITNC